MRYNLKNMKEPPIFTRTHMPVKHITQLSVQPTLILHMINTYIKNIDTYVLALIINHSQYQHLVLLIKLHLYDEML